MQVDDVLLSGIPGGVVTYVADGYDSPQQSKNNY